MSIIIGAFLGGVFFGAILGICAIALVSINSIEEE